jgi:hypothetical protein
LTSHTPPRSGRVSLGLDRGLQLLVGVGLQLTGLLSQPRSDRIGIHHDAQVGFMGEVFYERGFA